MSDASPLLFCFGFGYCAAALARRLEKTGWRAVGTHRADFARVPQGLLDEAQAILSSVPPDDRGDPVLERYGESLSRSRAWRGYLSTTGVYGDAGGAWLDEDAPLTATSERGMRRIAAEESWLGLGAQVFRLAGIYGPGRSQIEAVREGRAKRLVKPGQVFSRIHVADVANVLEASIARPDPGRAYNVADDEPAPPQDVVAYAAALLNLAPPPEIPFEAAARELSPMALSFYADNKRIVNRRIKDELGVALRFPNYREGLRDCLGDQASG